MGTLQRSAALEALPAEQWARIRTNLESLLSPEVQNQLPIDIFNQLKAALAGGMRWSFVLIIVVAAICLVVCLSLPAEKRAP
jgi:hypothetical protein